MMSQNTLDVSAGLSGPCLIAGESVNLYNQYGRQIDKVY